MGWLTARAGTETMSGLESESLISPLSYSTPQSAQACVSDSPNWLATPSPRTRAAPAAPAAYWKSPSHKQCWLRIMPQRWRLGEGSWAANPNRLDFDLYSAYVFMIPMWVAMSQIQD